MNMATNESSIITVLRDEIEKKYREALAALDTISGYVSAVPSPQPLMVKKPAPAASGSQSKVDRVYGALDTQNPKTVAQIHAQTGLAEEAVRAVLYSKAAGK